MFEVKWDLPEIGQKDTVRANQENLSIGLQGFIGKFQIWPKFYENYLNHGDRKTPQASSRIHKNIEITKNDLFLILLLVQDGQVPPNKLITCRTVH